MNSACFAWFSVLSNWLRNVKHYEKIHARLAWIVKFYIMFFMAIDLSCDYIALWRTIDEVIPYSQYKSGARSEHDPQYNDNMQPSSNPVLTLNFDILNKDGFGLKRGFYELAVDKDYKFLMFVQGGLIKAKIPVVKVEQINEYGSDFEWGDEKDESMPDTASKNLENEITVASKKIYTKPYTEKELKRRKKKYKKGQDPSMYFHSLARLDYDKENDLYKVIFEKYNTRITGILKVQ